MKTNFLKAITLLICLIKLQLSITAAQQISITSKMPTLKKSGLAPVNGLKMYYEIHGEGKPLVLIHGSFMTIDLNYGDLIPELAKQHQVIALELQGHGRTADVDRAYSFEAMADDVAALIQYLKIDSAAVLGYSLGATVVLELAIKHPKQVSKLVFISSVFKSDGWNKTVTETLKGITPEMFENTPLKTEYIRVAPDTTQWAAFITKLGKFDGIPFDLGSENVKALKCPVLIINGDNDGVELTHTAEMYKLLGGGVVGDIQGIPASRLVVLPGKSHVSLMMATNELLPVINSFLDNSK